MFDGDTIFAPATGRGAPADVNVVGALGAEAMAEAVVDDIREATSLAGIPAARDL